MLTAWWEGILSRSRSCGSWKKWQEAARGTRASSKRRRPSAAGPIDRLAETLEPGPAQTILRGFGQVIRKPLEVMNGTGRQREGLDRPASMELQAQAIRQATVEGLEGAAARDARRADRQGPALAHGLGAGTGRRVRGGADLHQGSGGHHRQRDPARPEHGTPEWAQFLYRATILVPIFRTAVRIAEGQLDYSGNPAHESCSPHGSARTCSRAARGGKWPRARW